MTTPPRSPGDPYHPEGLPQQPPPNYPPPGAYPAQPPYYPPPPPAKKKGRGCLIAALIAVALVVIVIIAIVAAIGKAADDGKNKAHTVIYEITGNGTKATNVTYLNINGDGSSGSEQAADAPLPFSKTIEGKGDFSAYSLVGQAGDGTSISCKITVDGKVVSTQTSTGQFAVVSCSGTP